VKELYIRATQKKVLYGREKHTGQEKYKRSIGKSKARMKGECCYFCL